MKKIVFFIIFSSLLVNKTKSQDIKTVIELPTSFQFVGTSIKMQVYVNSTYQLTSVKASIGIYSTDLIFNGFKMYYEGYLNNNGFTQEDTLSLNVTVIDVLNNKQVTTVKVIYDPPPFVTIKEPLNESVANPYLPVKIFSSDRDTCNIEIKYFNNVVYKGTIKDSLITKIDLGILNALNDSLEVDVWDKRIQHTYKRVYVYVDTSTFLREYYVSETKIIDFKKNKILVSDGIALQYPGIIDINNSHYSKIPFKIKVNSNSLITPTGAFLAGVDSSIYPSNYSYGYDWNNQSITNLGMINSALSPKAAGNYIIWSNGTNLYRRDLTIRQTTLVSSIAGNIDNSILESGKVVYWDNSTYNINSFDNNNSTKLTDNSGPKWNTAPFADGNIILYRKSNPCCTSPQTYTINIIRNNTDSVLGNMDNIPPAIDNYYQASNGFSAYTVVLNGITNVWVRDPNGNKKQMTFFSQNTIIEKINSKGDIISRKGNKRYLSHFTGTTSEVSSNQGKVYVEDSVFYLSIGRSLFKINGNSSSSANSSTIKCNLEYPLSNQNVGNTIILRAAATSPFKISSIIASIDTTKSSLILNSYSNLYEGTINIKGYNNGDTIPIRITAQDAAGNLQFIVTKVLFSNQLLISMVEPLNESVARPYIPLKAYVNSNDTLGFRVTFANNILYSGVIKDSISLILNCSVFNGTADSIRIDVYDKFNIHQYKGAYIYVDSSSSLKEYYISNKRILDFNYNKLLLSGGANLQYSSLLNINNNSEEIIPLKFKHSNKSKVTKWGAILTGADSSLYFNGLNYAYDWNNSIITNLGDLNGPQSMVVSGNFASWSNASKIFLRNLATLSNTMVSSIAGNTSNAIDASGKLVYWDKSYNINVFENGINKVITTNADNKWNTYPLVDGNDIVFRKTSPCCIGQTQAIQYISDSVNVELSYMGSLSTNPYNNYLVKNHIVAFSKPSQTNTNIWIRTQDGNLKQLTFYSDSPIMEEMDKNGNIIFRRTNNRRYLVNKDGIIKEIGSVNGQIYSIDSSLFISIGRMLFKVNTDVSNLAPPNNIKQNYLKPILYQEVGDTINVALRVSSNYQLRDVTAYVLNTSKSLTHNNILQQYEGQFIVSNLKRNDTIKIITTATDIFNNENKDSISVIYSFIPPPILKVYNPKNETVARPKLPIQFAVVSTDSCNYEISYIGSTIGKGKLKDSLSTFIDLSSFNGSSDSLMIKVWDSKKQEVIEKCFVYVEFSTNLNEYYEADNKIIDYSNNKLLVKGGSGFSKTKLIDINTNYTSLIPLSIYLSSGGNSFITPYGAILIGVDSSIIPNTQTLGYDWNNGNISILGNINNANSLKIAGKHAIWSDQTSLFYRNLETKISKKINANAGNNNNSISENGKIAFWDMTYNVYSYSNEITTKLTSNAANKWNTYPLSDGNKVVYRNSDPCCNSQNFIIKLADEKGIVELSNMNKIEPLPNINYQIRNGYIAYTKIGGNNNYNIWLRDSMSNQTQMTYYSENSDIEFLDTNGNIIFNKGGKRYISINKGQTIELTSAIGKTYYQNNNYFVSIGRSLFKLNIPTIITDVFQNLKLTKENLNNIFTWKADFFNGGDRYELVRSTDNMPYIKVAASSIKGDFQNPGEYRIVDSLAPKSNNNYKLVLHYFDSSITESKVFQTNSADEMHLVMYPNPTTNNLYISVALPNADKLKIQILDMGANVLMTLFETTNSNGSFQKSIQTNSLKPGIYYLNINGTSESITKQFIKL